MKTNLHARFSRLPAPSPAEHLHWRDGTLRDYDALGAFHYLRHKPVTATRVLVLEDRRPSVVGRYIQRRPTAQTVGVLVESYPALNCTLRDLALGGRFLGWPDRPTQARLLNAELRCISRVIVHSQWRGLGLAVRLVRRALSTMRTPYTEALAAMGRVHPFFERAGMTAYRRWPLAKDQRLLDALAFAGIEPWQLASRPRMTRHMAGPHAALLKREFTRWAGRRLHLADQLAAARDHLLCEPVYYLKRGSNVEEQTLMVSV